MGLHLHISEMVDGYKPEYGPETSGGIGIHYRTPPDYMKDDAPSCNPCWLIGGPCWHDGSSMQATEFWIPFWLANRNDHERMFRALEKELNDRDSGYGTPTVLKVIGEIQEPQP
jgi:hypothetical protein